MAMEIDELDRQVRRGSMFTQAVLNRGMARLSHDEAVLSALLEVLEAKGIVSDADMDAALNAEPEPEAAAPMPSDESPAATPTVSWPTIALRRDADTGPVEEPTVDCASRMHVCKAVCCRLRFMLSAEEVDAGAVKWDIGHPYVIRHDGCGMCVHNDTDSQGCTVYEDRPRVCRQYDCTHDTRIWKDFDGMVLNDEWIAEHLGPRDISVGAAMPSMLPGAGQ